MTLSLPSNFWIITDTSAMAQATLAAQPLVSVVTPFYNTAAYLAQCIESVLTQTYPHFEYILMDNCSTDGSSEIAESYARCDPRIRLIRCSEFLSQLANYNRALTQISDRSRYCKIVQADDWIFPPCLELMVRRFERSESIGLVCSYWLEGGELRPTGFPRYTAVLTGRESVRWFWQTGISIFGTQTQVMYRSSLVRYDNNFYNAAFHFADLQKHIELLENSDFGFVHQILSFSRRDNDGSILGSLQEFEPYQLVPYVMAQRYASVFLEADEAARIIARRKRAYYRDLARAALRLKGRAFWRYHKAGLKAFNERATHEWLYFMLQMVVVLLWLMINPGRTVLRIGHHWKLSIKAKGLKKSRTPAQGAMTP